VEGVGRHMDDEQDPTWDEAVAAFEAATPVELVRPLRKITVAYRYADGTFTATSPDLRGFEVSGSSLSETKRLVALNLRGFLDPTVELLEREPSPEPTIGTAPAGRSRLKASSGPGVFVVNTFSSARAFISPVKASMQQVQA